MFTPFTPALCFLQSSTDRSECIPVRTIRDHVPVRPCCGLVSPAAVNTVVLETLKVVQVCRRGDGHRSPAGHVAVGWCVGIDWGRERAGGMGETVVARWMVAE